MLARCLPREPPGSNGTDKEPRRRISKPLMMGVAREVMSITRPARRVISDWPIPFLAPDAADKTPWERGEVTAMKCPSSNRCSGQGPAR